MLDDMTSWMTTTAAKRPNAPLPNRTRESLWAGRQPTVNDIDHAVCRGRRRARG